MIYFTGDIHGVVDGVVNFVNKVHPSTDDVIVLLGDVGANYYRDQRDNLLKALLNDLGTVFLCIHGNHERRPTTIPGYVETEWHGGRAWVQPEYPNLIFAKDGEIYTLNGLRYLVIGLMNSRRKKSRHMWSSRFRANLSTSSCLTPARSNMNQPRCSLA